MRRERDLYQESVWMVEQLRRRVPIEGKILDPCSGKEGAIVRAFAPMPVRANDIDVSVAAHSYHDARDLSWWPLVDWVVSNPPFSHALEVAENSLASVRVGAALLLRLSFLEPTKGTVRFRGRHTFLLEHPPSKLIVLPRYSFTGDGHHDSVTVAWMIWSREPLSGPPICVAF